MSRGLRALVFAAAWSGTCLGAMVAVLVLEFCGRLK